MTSETHLDGDDDAPIEPSDAQIIDAVRGGDIGDFALLWRRHVDAARRAARAISPSSDPDDLVSEAFASILRITKAGGGPSDAFRPYLLATLRNTAARWSKGNGLLSIELVSERDLTPEGSDPIERISERSSVAAVFGKLSPRHRTLLWYLEVEGMKPRELAPLMGITPNAVSALALRARESFRRAWLEAHIHDPSRSEECRWFCERLVAQRERPLSEADAGRFEAHLGACRGCQLVAAEIDTVWQRLRSILPAAVIGGLAGSLYLGDDGRAVADSAPWSDAGETAATEHSALEALPATLTGRVGVASHAAASGAIPASGLTALVATAVVMVGAVVLAGSALNLPDSQIASDASSVVEPPERADGHPTADAGSDPGEVARTTGTEDPEAEQPEPHPLFVVTVPSSETTADATPAPSASAQSIAPPSPRPTASPMPTVSPTPSPSPMPTESPRPEPGSTAGPLSVDSDGFHLTQTIPQGSLVPPRIEGSAAPGSRVVAFDESGAVLDAAAVGNDGTFSLDVSGERLRQGMTVRLQHTDPQTGAIQWMDPVGPLSFATPRIATASDDLCSAAPVLWGDCLHLWAARGAWVELHDAQERSLIVRLQPGTDDGILRDAGVLGPVISARYIDPTSGRAGVMVALSGGDQ